MENCTTTEELAGFFQQKIADLRLKVELRHLTADPGGAQLIKAVNTQLDGLRAVLTLMRAELNREREALEMVQAMRAEVPQLQREASYALDNLPTRLPGIAAEALVSAPPASQKHPPRLPLGELPQNKLLDSGPVSARPTIVAKATSKAKNIPAVSILTVEEFDAVPKYMKGRMTYNQANASIEEFNKAVKAKYAVVFAPKTKQSQAVKTQIIQYREQETKNTKGIKFITDEDIKTHSRLKLDKAGRSLLTILRHCGRISEIRGAGLNRYAVSE